MTSEGLAKNSQVHQSSGYKILDNAVLDFIKNERFLPKTESQTKVAAEQFFTFRFELN